MTEADIQVLIQNHLISFNRTVIFAEEKASLVEPFREDTDLVVSGLDSGTWSLWKERLQKTYENDSVIQIMDSQRHMMPVRLEAAGKEISVPRLLVIRPDQMKNKPSGRYSLEPLEEVMNTLLGEGGCPWDKAQTHKSLRTYFIQEVYEVIDAIDEGNPEHLQEELGDCLYQIIFHSALAEREGLFTLQDVVQGVVRKMKSRHPGIFRDNVGQVSDGAAKDKLSWEDRKNEAKNRKHLLDGVPKCLPSLLLACIIQKKVSSTEVRTTRNVHEISVDIQRSLTSCFKKVGDKCKDGTDNELGRLLFVFAAAVLDAGKDPELLLHEYCMEYIRMFTAWETEIQAKYSGAKLSGSQIRNLWAVHCRKKNATESEETPNGCEPRFI